MVPRRTVFRSSRTTGVLERRADRARRRTARTTVVKMKAKYSIPSQPQPVRVSPRVAECSPSTSHGLWSPITLKATAMTHITICHDRRLARLNDCASQKTAGPVNGSMTQVARSQNSSRAGPASTAIPSVASQPAVISPTTRNRRLAWLNRSYSATPAPANSTVAEAAK